MTGAALRDSNGFYRVQAFQPLPSVTTILDFFFARGQEAAGYAVAVEAGRLATMSLAGEQERVWMDYVDEETGERASFPTMVDPREVITKTVKLSNHWRKVLRRAGDVGTTVHGVVAKWAAGEPVFCGNAHDHAADVISRQGLSCSVDDVRMKAQSAVAWLERNKVEPIAWETTVLTDSEDHGYAGTFDLLGRIGKYPWLLDFKTSVAVDYVHVLQLSAYKHAQYFLTPTGVIKDLPRIPFAAVVKVSDDNAMARPLRSTAPHARVFRRLTSLYWALNIKGLPEGLDNKRSAMSMDVRAMSAWKADAGIEL